MEIRQAELKDAKAIAVITQEELGYATNQDITETQLKSLLSKPTEHYVYVAEHEGDVLGFIHAQRYESILVDTGLNILALAVSHSAQGRGVGKALLTKLEADARLNQLHFIRLNSNVTRTAAHQFYEHVGYVSNKTQKRFIKELKDL